MNAHTWTLPAEPGPEVRAVRVDTQLWIRDGHPDYPWRSGRICTTWPMVLALGTAVDATHELKETA